MSRKTERAPFKLKSITDSLRDEVTSGQITIHEAALELFRANHTSYIDVETTRRILCL